MTLSCKSIALWLLCLVPIVAIAKTPADTSVKRTPLLLGAPGYQISDYSSYLKGAISAFGQDSVDKAITLLSRSIKNISQQKDVKRIMPYQGYEIFNLIEMVAGSNNNLSPAERQTGKAFLKMIFMAQPDESTGDAKVDNFFKKVPNTIFTERLKLFATTFRSKAEANVKLNRLLKSKPDLLSANMLKAELLFDDGKFEESITYCNKVLTLWPQYAHAYHVRAQCYYNLKKTELSVADYTKAIDLFAGVFALYYERADCYLDIEKYREAANDLHTVKRLSPGYKWPNYDLTRCYRGLNMPDSALYFINQHINDNTNDGFGYDLKGNIYYDRDEYETAVNLYTQAINLDPDKRSFYIDRADAYYYWDKLDDAIKDLQKAISIDNSYPFAYDRLGDCYYQKKEYETAISYHQKAIKADPTYKYAYTGLGLNYNQLGKYQEAIDAAKKATAIDSTYALAWGNMGWACYCAGKFDDCITYSYKAIKYENDATYAMFNIALATLRKGEIEKAKKLYIDFIKTCKDNNYKIRPGATDDLRDLIKNNIYVAEATFIIQQLFGQNIQP